MTLRREGLTKSPCHPIFSHRLRMSRLRMSLAFYWMSLSTHPIRMSGTLFYQNKGHLSEALLPLPPSGYWSIVFHSMDWDNYCSDLTNQQHGYSEDKPIHGEIIIDSTYITPSADFEKTLAEQENLSNQSRAFISNDKFNGNSSLCGDRCDYILGDLLAEQLVVHNLPIVHLHNTNATFETLNSNGEVITPGWPDLPLVNSQTLSKIPVWFTSDTFSSSDHKYIHYTY